MFVFLNGKVVDMEIWKIYKRWEVKETVCSTASVAGDVWYVGSDPHVRHYCIDGT